jgi:hypothetical protein
VKKGLCYKAGVKSEDSGPLNWVKIYVLSQIIIDGNDCLLYVKHSLQQQ